MIATTKTAAGWVIETTPRHDGALVQGTRAGRRVLYTREQLERAGIDYAADPAAPCYAVDGSSRAEVLLATVDPARVLRRGTEVA